jgi:serine/threonine protein kinase
MYISYGGGSTVDVGVINIANAIMDFERDNFYSKKYKENIYKHYNFPKKIDSLKVGTEREIVEKSKEECKDIVRFSEEDFEKIKKLGSGSYGRVYEVKSRTTGTVTAVKSIKLEDGVVPYTTNIEIGILKEINNPHIIKLLNVSLSKNQAELYMVFEKMDSTLRDKVENMNLLKFYMYQLFVGLYAIHSKSIIHRDLKGDNILMKNDTLKIADFGLAIFSYPGKKLSTHVGTLWWRAPEVLLGDKYYGCAIDMWAAGVIMVELLGGLELFQSNNEIEQILKIFNVCGTPTNSTWPGVEELPGYKKNFPKFKGMDTIIPNFTDPLGNDLLRQLLTLDPQRRITALEALQHPFLKSGKILEF